MKATAALGVKHLTIRGDSQLLVNFSNKVYEPKDEHMEAYLTEVRKMEKQFLGLELQHVPRGTNKETDDIARRASKRQPQEPGVFEERLIKPSATPPLSRTALPREELPQPPATGAPACGPTSGTRLLLALEPQEGCWTECRCQNRRISGRGSRTVRLGRMVTGGRVHEVLPKFEPSRWR